MLNLMGNLNPVLAGQFKSILGMNFAEEGGEGGGSGSGEGAAGAGGEGGGAGEGGGGVALAENLGESFKTDKSFSSFKTVDDLAKSYKELLSYQGRSVAVPGKDAKPEEVKAFRMKLGMPEKPDGYKLTPPEKLHERVKPTPELENSFREKMHARGVPAGLANELWQDFLSEASVATARTDELSVEQTKTAETTLRKEWAGEYDRNLSLANKFIERMLGPQATKEFSASGHGRDVNFLKLCAKAGKLMSEDSVSRLGFSSLETDSDSAKAKITEINNDPKHAYWNENDPKHGEAVKEMRRLYKAVHGEAQ